MKPQMKSQGIMEVGRSKKKKRKRRSRMDERQFRLFNRVKRNSIELTRMYSEERMFENACRICVVLMEHPPFCNQYSQRQP